MTNKLILIIFYLAISIIYRRYYPIFCLIAFSSLVDSYNQNVIQLINRSAQKMHFLTLSLFLFLVYTLNLFGSFCTHSSLKILSPFALDKSYPNEAVNFLKNNTPTQNLFNSYYYGGYLTWNFDQTIFIDGRAPQAKTANHSTLLREYSSFFTTDYKLTNQQIEKYSIASFLLDKQTTSYSFLDKWICPDIKPVNESENLIRYLSKNPAWNKVYEDNISVIYFKKN